MPLFLSVNNGSTGIRRFEFMLTFGLPEHPSLFDVIIANTAGGPENFRTHLIINVNIINDNKHL